MTKKFIIVLAILIQTLQGICQDNWMSFEMGFGGQFPNYKQLNMDLNNLNLSEAPSGLMAGTFGLEIGKRKFLLGLEGSLLSSTRESNYDNRNTNLKIQGMNSRISLGYKFSLGDGFFIYPLVGICGGTNDLIFTGKVTANNIFNSVLDSTRNQLTLSNYYLSPILGGQFLFPLGDISHIALKFGFGLPPFKDIWEIDKYRLTKTPRSNPSLFFIGINFIFYIQDNDWRR